jgi:hypothetical protein
VAIETDTLRDSHRVLGCISVEEERLFCLLGDG